MVIPSFVVLRELHLYRILIYALNGGPDHVIIGPQDFSSIPRAHKTNPTVAYSTLVSHSILTK
jgi:hypothetical protein